jgi:putative tryptophan/tyrosine transport system substrate-binding protein
MPATHAQQDAYSPRIAFLGPTASAPTSTATTQLDVLRKALAECGLVEGRTIVIDSRWPDVDRLDRLPESAAALIALKPAVLITIGATAARAAIAATTDVPIVFEVVVDPLATGLTSSLERPGGNVTGFTTFDPLHARRQLELLQEVIPGLTRVALLGDAGAAPGLSQTLEDAARDLGLVARAFKVARGLNPDFDGALEAAKKESVDAVIVLSTPVTTPHRRQIAEAAAKHSLPTLSPRDHEDAGGLMCYGTSFAQLTRNAAGYVDRILTGAQPGDLPVETVRQPELIINLRAARALGLTLPASVLSKATRVVE